MFNFDLGYTMFAKIPIALLITFVTQPMTQRKYLFVIPAYISFFETIAYKPFLFACWRVLAAEILVKCKRKS